MTSSQIAFLIKITVIRKGKIIVRDEVTSPVPVSLKKIKVLQYLVPEVASKDQMGKSKEIYFFWGGGRIWIWDSILARPGR
jgi:hypothetical protein